MFQSRAFFYESHDVLEELWLGNRHALNYSFYKGLIQLAGAFVHLQKNRLRPAAALFTLARANSLKYPAVHERLDVVKLLAMILEWLDELELTDFSINTLQAHTAPQLHLLDKLE